MGGCDGGDNDYYFLAGMSFIILLVIFVIVSIHGNDPKQYEANCIVGTYQVYHDGFNYYLQETDEEFFDYGNCVFVETKR